MPGGDEPEPEGPADWIGRAYERHGAGLYRYALKLLVDPDAAADVVQQVFLALVRRPPALDKDLHCAFPGCRRSIADAWMPACRA